MENRKYADTHGREISPPQSLLPSNAQILNLMLVNLFIIVFILLVIHCVWQNNKNNKGL